jgi:hypothetical protein
MLIVILSSGARVTTKRQAFISYSEKNIYCRISGFYLSLINPEGTFPEWVNGIYIKLNDGVPLPAAGQAEYVAFRDFQTRYKEITSGTANIDIQKRLVKVNFSYNDSYKWQKVNGDFPIVSIK